MLYWSPKRIGKVSTKRYTFYLFLACENRSGMECKNPWKTVLPSLTGSMWTIHFASSARKDAKKITKSGLKSNAENLLLLLSQDPFLEPPPFKSLQGDLSGAFSRRLDYQHRIVYEVFEEIKAVRILRMWSHYE